MRCLVWGVAPILIVLSAVSAQADLVTYGFSQAPLNNGSTVTGSLTLDLGTLGDPTDITFTELNAADFSITVTPPTPPGTLFSEFTLTDANSTWALQQGNVTIGATATELTFNFTTNGFLTLALNDTTSTSVDSLSFLDFGDSILRLRDTEVGGSNLDQSDFGPLSPSFTFSAVPEPSSLLLLGVGGVGMMSCRRRRKSNKV